MEKIELTLELLNKGKSIRGAWSAKQLKIFGLDFNNLKKGWKKRIVGSSFLESDIKEFIRLKDNHLSADVYINAYVKKYDKFR